MKLRILSAAARPLAVGLVLIAGASAMGQITKQGNGFLMRMKFVAGQTTNYVINSKNSVPGMSSGAMDMTMPMRTTVKSVKNGVATIDAVLGPMKMGERTMPEQKTSLTMNARGQVTGADAAMQQMQSIQFPQGPVPIGGTWSNDMKMPAGPMGNMSIRSTYRIVRTVTRNGVPLLEISITGASSGNSQMKVAMTGSMFLRMSDGSLQSSTSTQNITMAMPSQEKGKAPQTMKISATTTITRR